MRTYSESAAFPCLADDRPANEHLTSRSATTVYWTQR